MPLLIAFLQVIEREIVFCFCGCVAVATGVFCAFAAELPDVLEPEPLEAPLFPAFHALPFVGCALPDGVCVFVAAFVGNAAGADEVSPTPVACSVFGSLPVVSPCAGAVFPQAQSRRQRVKKQIRSFLAFIFFYKKDGCRRTE